MNKLLDSEGFFWFRAFCTFFSVSFGFVLFLASIPSAAMNENVSGDFYMIPVLALVMTLCFLWVLREAINNPRG